MASGGHLPIDQLDRHRRHGDRRRRRRPTIKVANNFFLTFETGSTTTLNGNLRLVNNNINIEAGATFSGAGAIVIPDGSHMVADNLADIGVLLDMQGASGPATPKASAGSNCSTISKRTRANCSSS